MRPDCNQCVVRSVLLKPFDMSWKLSEWRWRQDAGMLDGSLETRGNLHALRRRAEDDSAQEEAAIPLRFADEGAQVDANHNVASGADVDQSENVRSRVSPASDLPPSSISSPLSLLMRKSTSTSPSHSSHARLLQHSESRQFTTQRSCASYWAPGGPLEDINARVFAFDSPHSELGHTSRDLLQSRDRSAQSSRQGRIPVNRLFSAPQTKLTLWE